MRYMGFVREPPATFLLKRSLNDGSTARHHSLCSKWLLTSFFMPLTQTAGFSHSKPSIPAIVALMNNLLVSSGFPRPLTQKGAWPSTSVQDPEGLSRNVTTYAIAVVDSNSRVCVPTACRRHSFVAPNSQNTSTKCGQLRRECNRCGWRSEWCWTTS